MSESEPSYVRPVTENWRKRLNRQNQKVSGWDRVIDLRATILNNSRRVTDGIHPQALESSLINRVNPMHPTLALSAVVSGPQGTGMVQGAKEIGKSECHAVTTWIGPQTRGYPTRKGADFRMVFLGHEISDRPNPGGG